MADSVKTPIKKGVAKVPVMIQMEALECGAACLAMILAYYGKWISLSQVRKDCGVSRDGSSMKKIYLAATNYGMKVEGYRWEPKDLMETATFPCIIHWNFNHFVVLNGFQNNTAVINDPARAIAPKPKILIFDEATSALDNKTQKQVSEALDKMNCTRIVIAHRLSTIRNCDRILMLQDGEIIEEGTYDELIRLNGEFSDMVARQQLS